VHDPNQTVITEAEIGYLIVIEIQLVVVILRDDMVGGSVDDFSLRRLRQRQYTHSGSSSRERVHVELLMD
jgi:hypothetical protein